MANINYPEKLVLIFFNFIIGLVGLVEGILIQKNYFLCILSYLFVSSSSFYIFVHVKALK